MLGVGDEGMVAMLVGVRRLWLSRGQVIVVLAKVAIVGIAIITLVMVADRLSSLLLRCSTVHRV